MSEFLPKSLAVLGRQPELGLAELESLYGAERIQPIRGAALLDIEPGEISFDRLGGTIKLGRVLNILPTTEWKEIEKYLSVNIPKHLKYLPAGTFTMGLSAYNLNLPLKTLNQTGMRLKRLILSSGRSVRVVPNKSLELNSAQVLHNKLTRRGAWELLFFEDEGKTILAQTWFVQDIEKYGARDQARPKRDARVGMLPPKLAQIIINLASPGSGGTVLDPFCGTGVIIQEALLMGFNAVGTDIDQRMVEYCQTNINWLKRRYENISANATFNIEDATTAKWSDVFDAIAAEIYLGRPFAAPPAAAELPGQISEIEELLKKFLKNIHPQIKKGVRLCLAVPAWQMADGTVKHMPIIDHLTDIGYNYLDFKYVLREQLVYSREDQVVARQLLVIHKD